MRNRVAVAIVVALLVALPAAARLQDETVTLSAGKSLRLKTVFEKAREYKVTVSGVVTLTVSNSPITIDPLFSYTGNCQNPSARSGVRLIDSRGFDVFSPFSTVPAPKCRSDHTYTFTLNGPTPRTGVLNGRITAKNDITVNTARGDTASGSFKLVVEAEPAEPAAIVRFGANAKQAKGILDQAHLNGRGVMTAETIRQGDLADRARLLPVATLSGEMPAFRYVREGIRDRRLALEVTSGELIMRGAAGSAAERFSLRLIVEVIASNVPACPASSKTRNGARGKLILVDYPRGAPDRFVNASLDLPCGEDEGWVSTDSDVTIRVTLKKP